MSRTACPQASCQSGCQGIRPFEREQRSRLILGATLDQAICATGETCDIADRHGPFVNVAIDSHATKPDLNRAHWERVQVNVTFGVPLDPHGHGLSGLPRNSRLMYHGVEMSQDRIAKSPVKTVSGNLNRQNVLLSWLRCPTGAVHHPQERGLDPSHALAVEGKHEVACTNCWLGNLGAICLVYRDRSVGEECTNLPVAVTTLDEDLGIQPSDLFSLPGNRHHV